MFASHMEVVSRFRSVFLTRVLPLLAVLWVSCSFGSMQAQSFQTIPALSFTKAYAGANPLPQVITVASTGSDFYFYISATTSSGGNWLKVDANSSSRYTTPTAITVSANPSVTLAAGTYSGQIVATSSDGSLTLTIPVSLTIDSSSSTFFDDLPGGLTFSVGTGGASPPAELLPVRNAGSGTLNFTTSTTTSDGGGWITLSAASGIAPALISASVDPAKLPGGGIVAGTFTGQVVLKTGSDTVTVPVTTTVGDSVFRQMNSLTFTKPYAGANPLPQVFTVASTGSDFYFYISATNSTGGDWLTIDANPSSRYSTPNAITVAASPSVTLTAGTYSAEIIAVSDGGAQKQVIPVTLNVEASTASFFDDLPGQLAFSMATGGTAPPAELVPIRNAGSGTLDFTASASTSDGGGWITLSETTGTAPSLLSVNIDPSKLPNGGLIAGTFTGQVLLKTGQDIVTIPVTTTVGDSVFRQINPLTFTKTYKGADPLPQVFTVASTGSDFYFYISATNSTGGNWLTIDANASTRYSTPNSITVTANPSVTLAAGTYSAEIIAVSYGGTQTQVIPVTLNIETSAVPFFDDSPGQLTFSLATGGTAPPAELVPIRNAGSGSLDFTASASTSDGGGWITLSQTSGTAPSLLSVSIDPSRLPNGGLVAGTFTGQVLLKTGSGIVSVPVTTTVGDSVFRQVNPLSFVKAYQGTNPLPQGFTVASTGSDFYFYVSATNSTGGNWLTIDKAPSSRYSTSQEITVSANPSVTLPVGAYSAEIIAVSYGGAQSEVIPVTLNIQTSTAPFFDDLPGELTFSTTTSGTNPDSLPLPIRNAGTGTLDWTATPTTADGGGWLTISTASGSAPSTPVVTVIASNLPGQGLIAGTFTGQIVLQSAGRTATVPVTVTVGDSVFSQIQPVKFSKDFKGTNPASQVVTISSTGSNLYFYLAAVNSTGGNWLKVNTNSSARYGTPQAVTLTANPDINLASGIYTASIYVQSYGGAEPLIIPVTLTIAGPPAATSLQFIPVTPCRVVDTRGNIGGFGAPVLSSGAMREFDVPQSDCGIPSTAVAYSLNVTVLPETTLNYLTMWPSGTAQPNVSTLNSYDGRIKANAAIVPAGSNGGVNVFVSDASNVILDINGYFVPAGTTSALAFYPLTPCRVADTRGGAGPLGGPFVAGQTSRSFPVQSSACNIPATAQAYSLNLTTLAHSTLNYLTTWPSGQAQPNVSTLNAPTGAVTANAAIVPAGTNGDISLFVSDDADVILDINGYFAPAATGGLSLYTTTPCRVLDTRGALGVFSGVLQTAVETSTCSLPAAAQAYVLNSTVVPPGPLNYLTLWPDGEGQPNVSTLNANDAAITSNMAIVPTTNGKIDAFSSDPVQLILDISSYFAP